MSIPLLQITFQGPELLLDENGDLALDYPEQEKTQRNTWRELAEQTYFVEKNSARIRLSSAAEIKWMESQASHRYSPSSHFYQPAPLRDPFIVRDNMAIPSIDCYSTKCKGLLCSLSLKGVTLAPSNASYWDDREAHGASYREEGLYGSMRVFQKETERNIANTLRTMLSSARVGVIAMS